MARHPRQLFATLAACCALWLFAGTAQAEQEQIAVIVSRHAPGFDLDRATLRDIYLKKIFLDERGHALIPVNLPPDNPLRHAFTRETLRMSRSHLQSYWNRHYFQGVSPPYVLGSEQAVIQFVAKTPGAIGYVRPCFLNREVRQVLSLSLPAPLDREKMATCPPR